MIVAEIGANHNGSLARAFRLIDAAKDAGADAVKLQAYTADTLTLDCDGPGFTVTAGPWAGRRLYDLYKEAETPPEWLAPLFAHARKSGILCFASVFDLAGVDRLDYMDCPFYKIASFEITDTGLIEQAGLTGKPVIISTGMASDEEIWAAIDAAATSELTLLHCVSAYPTKPEQANLMRIKQMREEFGFPVGLSDHTLGIAMPVAATALGAWVIEKHLTLSRADGGLDASFSLEPDEFKAMVSAVRETRAAMLECEPPEPHKELRRSLYAVKDIAAGEKLTHENIRSIRPGHGLPPWRLWTLIGRVAKQPIARGTPLTLDMVGETN